MYSENFGFGPGGFIRGTFINREPGIIVLYIILYKILVKNLLRTRKTF